MRFSFFFQALEGIDDEDDDDVYDDDDDEDDEDDEDDDEDEDEIEGDEGVFVVNTHMYILTHIRTYTHTHTHTHTHIHKITFNNLNNNIYNLILITNTLKETIATWIHFGHHRLLGK